MKTSREFFRAPSGCYLVAVWVERAGGYRVSAITPGGDVPLSSRKVLGADGIVRRRIRYYRRDQLGRQLTRRPDRRRVAKQGW